MNNEISTPRHLYMKEGAHILNFKGQRKSSLRKAKKAALKVVMPKQVDLSKISPDNLSHPSLYINRELGWLEFNQRVLDQTLDPAHPLLERIKFLAISGSNLDEFYMIRVATILKKLRAEVEDISPDGLSTTQQLQAIRERTQKMMQDQTHSWAQVLRPLLAREGIHFLDLKDYSEEIRNYLADFFRKDVFPTLTPLAFDPGHPFPFISNLSMNFAVVVNHNEQVKFARVKIPSTLPRFIQLPEHLVAQGQSTYVFLGDVIRDNIRLLFPGADVLETYLFRIIRDTDIVIQEDEADDLLESVDKSLKQLRYGALSLLLVESQTPQKILSILAENFEVSEDVISTTGDRMGFADWMQLYKMIHRPQLKDASFQPRVLFEPDDPDPVFEKIKQKDYLVHHPYESFSAVETFLKQAVDDPNVVAIKMTLYRIGQNSPIIDRLIEAVDAGKQVAVLVELKARFDEKNNIVWAKRLEEAGAHVVYGLLNLKTHSKLCLVVRKEADGIRRYVHIGSGNYNRATSQVYTDFGLFTSSEKITEEVSEVFNYLTGYSNKSDYKMLMVAPINFRKRIVELIQREISEAQKGNKAHLIFKLNAVADSQIIKELFKASQAGVRVDLIVRGICCLRPGIKGISENIYVRSIVGRFLEHSRVYYFLNGGNEEIYIGSGDLMERNLDRRVEVMCPILDETHRNHLKAGILDLLLSDTDRAYLLNQDGSYTRALDPLSQLEPLDAQKKLIDFYHQSLPIMLG